MATIADLTAPYASFLLGPRRGPDVCRVCCNLTDGYGRCYACAHGGRWLDVVSPISYSVAGEELHHALACYKRWPQRLGRRFGVELAAVLWRYLGAHERCLTRAAGVDAFPLVTAVPSSERARDEAHPLHGLVSELVGPTRARYRRLLRRSGSPAVLHEFGTDRYEPTTRLGGEPVLLVDDTWTTGASAQSAAAALKRAGSGPVATVVIGRFVNRGWHGNDRLLRDLPRPFDWDRCVLCDEGTVR